MSRRLSFAWVVAAACSSAPSPRPAQLTTPRVAPAALGGVDPRALMDEAMDAMGGAQLLRDLRSMSLRANFEVFRIDDSERSEPPYWLTAQHVDEVRDLQAMRYAQRISAEGPQFDPWVMTIVGTPDSTATNYPGPAGDQWSMRPDSGAYLSLAPERILQAAAAATDLRRVPDQVVHGVPHQVLQFTWQGFPVRVYLDRDSRLPDTVESVRTSAYDIAQSAWGDVTYRAEFEFWRTLSNGLRYPRQWNLYRNGELEGVYSIYGATPNATIDDAEFAVPDATRREFEATGRTPLVDYPFGNEQEPMVEVADGIWFIEGRWNVLVVRQPDGLVVVEAPQSSGYSTKVLGLLAQRFPGTRIAAMVSTTDATWHIAGVREYVAHGVPVYALAATLPLLRRLVDAPHTLAPDDLTKSPRAPELRPVDAATVVGVGPTRFVIHPIRGQSDERMLMVYFPDQQLLYGSSNDLFRGDDGAWNGTFNLPELVAAVRREHLLVRRYVSIHTKPMDWSVVARTSDAGLVIH